MKADEKRAYCEGFNEAAAEQRSGGCMLAHNPYFGVLRKAWADGAEAWNRQSTECEVDRAADDQTEA